MYFEDIPLYTNLVEVRECVAKTVLSVCDTAEFLGVEQYGAEDIYDLYGTKYEDIIPAFLSCRKGDSNGNMWGNIFRFKLTEPLKKHIEEEGLDCMFCDGGVCYLENLTLYREGKTMFSCVSHEVFCLYHMAEVSEDISQKVLCAVAETISKMPLYAAMQKIAARLDGKPQKDVERDLSILLDLCLYVDCEKEYFIRQTPKYECSFKNYKILAERYLTSETYLPLATLNSFAELQPQPVPKTCADALNGVGINTLHYISSEYYQKVNREISMLKFILAVRRKY